MTRTILLPVPPSVNDMYFNVRGRGRAKSQAYKQWITDADGYLLERAQLRGSPTIHGPYEVAIKLPAGTRGDVDNRTKAVLDYLVSRAITDDDKHCRRVSIERAAVDCCEVWITTA